MISRRPVPRLNRGRIASGGVVATIDFAANVGVQAVASLDSQISFAASIAVTIVASTGLIAASVDINPSKNITLGTTMRLTGTSPVCTIAAGSGSLTYATNPPAYKIVITSSTTFDIYYDPSGAAAHTGVTIPAGSTYTVPDGAGAGNVITFPAGTYTTNDTEESTCSSVTTADANAYVFSQGTAASQPVFSKDATGYHFFFNAGQTLECATAGLLALATNDPALTVMMKFAPTTAALAEDMLTWTQTGGTNGSHRFGKAVTGTGRLTHICVNDAASSTNSNQTRGVDDLTNGGLTKFCWYGPGSNGGTNCKVNDANLNPNAGTWNPGTVTPTRCTLGATHDNAVRRAFKGKIYRAAAFNSQLSASDQTAWNAAL